MSDDKNDLPINTRFTFSRWFWGLMAVAVFYFGTKRGVSGEVVEAVADYIIALGCLVGVVYYSIAARLNRLEARLILQSQRKD